MHANMNRGLTAAFLLSLIVVASADRALLNKPSGGALHGIALFGSNYYSTNGNGSWTPLATSPDASPNSGFTLGNSCAGSAPLATSPTGIQALSSMAITQSGLITVTFPSKSLGVAVGASCTVTTAGNPSTPNILITLDQANTWMAVTGVPTTTVAAAVSLSTGPIVYPYPAVSAPDLLTVFFASKSVGWAAGGSIGAAIDQSSDGSTGAILMTTNGGTVWTNVLPLAPANKLNVLGVPGCIRGIMSDSAGKNVYAVGAPAAVYTATPTWAAATSVTTTLNTFGTILYSANSGASWTMQTAPAIAGYNYALAAVYVQKGTTAWAVGGSIATPTGTTAAGNGIILGTFNGGFSWSMLAFPGSGSGKAPAFTSIAYNGRTAWVGGFISTAAFYPFPISATTPPVAGSSYTVLTSTDGKNFQPAVASSFPAGFVASSTTASAYGTNTVYGITWDNGVRGFIFGLSFILGTQDGGLTWKYETPNMVITTTEEVFAIANVPTTY